MARLKDMSGRIKRTGLGVLSRIIDVVTREQADESQGMSSIHKAVFEYLEHLARKRVLAEHGSLFRLLNGSRLHYCDVGARGGVPDWLLPYSQYLNISMFEPNLSEYDLLSRHFGEAKLNCYPFGVGNPLHTVLHVTKNPGLSSILEPFGNGWSLMRGDDLKVVEDKFTIQGTRAIQIESLKNLVHFAHAPIDILKIDVQGYEYDVLDGLGEHRPMLIQCEVSAIEVYKNQRTMGAVIAQLETLGYFPITFMPSKNHVHASGKARRSSYRFHGDVIFIPSYGHIGARIIDRWPMAWRCAMELWNLRDVGRHMRPELFKDQRN